MSDLKEIWKDIIGYIDIYMVSNYGRIKRFNKDNRYKSFKILKPHRVNKYGHLKIDLYKNSLRKTYHIHRLVLEAFIGSCPPGKEGCHNDGNPSNNFVDNLRWDTRLENIKDKIRHKTMPMGSKHGRAKLNEKQVRIIKWLLKDGCLTQKEIAKIFNVSKYIISKIKNNIIWRHV